MRTGLLCGLIAVLASPALAQTEQVTTVPPNLVLSNYNTVPIGPFGGLEGSAFVARVSDPSAAWFNPAGLTRATTAQISGSAGVYERTAVTPNALPNRGGSTQQLPNSVGFTFKPGPQLTLGVAMVSTNAWIQQTDSELITALPTGQQRIAYSADSDFEQRVLSIAAGYHGNGAWRFGGGFGFALMNLRLVQSTSDRIGDSSGLRSLLVTARTSASSVQLRSQFGAQYDTSRWRVGAAVRTPGLTILHSASVTMDGLLDAGASSLGASVFDPDAETEYHRPWEFQGGAAWVRERFEVELDVQAFSSIDPYPLVSTSNPAVIYGDAGANRPPTVISQPFPDLTSASDAVVNFSAGGHVRLFDNRDMRIHAGVGGNRSPVAAEETIFNDVDLLTWTLGVSGSIGRLQFAAGINQQFGDTENVMLRNLLNGRVVQSSMDVNMIGFIYSLGFQF